MIEFLLFILGVAWFMTLMRLQNLQDRVIRLEDQVEALTKREHGVQ